MRWPGPRRSAISVRVDLEEAWAHSLGFAAGAGPVPERVVDLGSGGGLPSFALIAQGWGAAWLLVEGRAGRAERLFRAVEELGWSDRVLVAHERAEEAAHGGWRGTADVVTARSFGPPGVTAECAVGFLRVGGRLVVSEPPESGETRWPAAGLGLLGLEVGESWTAGGGSFRSFVLAEPASTRLPRRAGAPKKRPAF